MPAMNRQTIRLQPDDDVILQYLGAAVVLQWHRLPEDVRQAIRQQTESVGGLPVAAKLREQMTSLIERSRYA